MQRIMNNNYAILAVALLAVALLVGAACSTTTQTNVNNRNAANTNTTPAGNMSNMNNMNHGGMSNMNHNGMGGMEHSNMQSSPNAASQPYDLQFIDTMIAHHQGAVDMARPALEKAQHNELKEMGRNVIRDQEREINQMRQWREQWYAGRPQAINMEMPGMMDSMRGMDMNRLNAQTGNAYDVMFLDMMIPHHQGAVTMAREALQRAEHPELRQLAQQIITSQEREIREMNQWKEAWR